MLLAFVPHYQRLRFPGVCHSQVTVNWSAAVFTRLFTQQRPAPCPAQGTTLVSAVSSPRLPRSLPASGALFSATLAVPAPPAHVCLTCSAARLTGGFWEDAGFGVLCLLIASDQGYVLLTVPASLSFHLLWPTVRRDQDTLSAPCLAVSSAQQLQRSAFRRTCAAPPRPLQPSDAGPTLRFASPSPFFRPQLSPQSPSVSLFLAAASRPAQPLPRSPSARVLRVCYGSTFSAPAQAPVTDTTARAAYTAHLFSHSSGGREPEIGALASLVSPEASFLAC